MDTSITILPPKPPKQRRPRKKGPVTQAERNLVAQVVADSALEPSPGEVKALATTLRRSVEAVKKIIEEARDKFAGAAQDYVRIHKQTVERALDNGDAKSLDVARQGSQWAIEKISAEGTRIVEKEKVESSGMKILIGVKVGSLNEGGPSGE